MSKPWFAFMMEEIDTKIRNMIFKINSVINQVISPAYILMKPKLQTGKEESPMTELEIPSN